jgi:hypothetical protein
LFYGKGVRLIFDRGKVQAARYYIFVICSKPRERKPWLLRMPSGSSSPDGKTADGSYELCGNALCSNALCSTSLVHMPFRSMLVHKPWLLRMPSGSSSPDGKTADGSYELGGNALCSNASGSKKLVRKPVHMQPVHKPWLPHMPSGHRERKPWLLRKPSGSSSPDGMNADGSYESCGNVSGSKMPVRKPVHMQPERKPWLLRIPSLVRSIPDGKTADGSYGFCSSASGSKMQAHRPSRSKPVHMRLGHMPSLRRNNCPEVMHSSWRRSRQRLRLPILAPAT